MTKKIDIEDEKLTKRQLLFVANYLICWNATEAARRSGYSKRSASIIGWENLRKPNIAKFITNNMADKIMSANEVLARLSQMASANLIDILNEDDEFDFELAREKGMTHLIRKLKRRQFTDKDGNTTRETEVEIYSALDALEKLGRFHKLFTTVMEHTGPNGGPIPIGVGLVDYRNAVAPVTTRPEPDRLASGEVEVSGDGPPLG